MAYAEQFYTAMKQLMIFALCTANQDTLLGEDALDIDMNTAWVLCLYTSSSINPVDSFVVVAQKGGLADMPIVVSRSIGSHGRGSDKIVVVRRNVELVILVKGNKDLRLAKQSLSNIGVGWYEEAQSLVIRLWLCD